MDTLTPADLEPLTQDPAFTALKPEDRTTVLNNALKEAHGYVGQNVGWTPQRHKDFGELAAGLRESALSKSMGEHVMSGVRTIGGVIADSVKSGVAAVVGSGADSIPAVRAYEAMKEGGNDGRGTVANAVTTNLHKLGKSVQKVYSTADAPLDNELFVLKKSIDDGELPADAKGLQEWLDQRQDRLKRAQIHTYTKLDGDTPENRAYAEANSLLGNKRHMELLADYLQTRDPDVWKQFRQSVQTGPSVAAVNAKQNKLANESVPGQVLNATLGKGGGQYLMEATDPFEVAGMLVPMIKGAKALKAVKDGSKLKAAGELVTGAAAESASELGSQFMDDPGASWQERLQVAKDAFIGSLGLAGMGAGGQVVKNKFLNRGQGNDDVSTNEATAAAGAGAAAGAAAQAAEMGGVPDEAGEVMPLSPLRGIAERAGAVDVRIPEPGEQAAQESMRVSASRPMPAEGGLRGPEIAVPNEVLQGQLRGLMQASWDVQQRPGDLKAQQAWAQNSAQIQPQLMEYLRAVQQQGATQGTLPEDARVVLDHFAKQEAPETTGGWRTLREAVQRNEELSKLAQRPLHDVNPTLRMMWEQAEREKLLRAGAAAGLYPDDVMQQKMQAAADQDLTALANRTPDVAEWTTHQSERKALLQMGANPALYPDALLQGKENALAADLAREHLSAEQRAQQEEMDRINQAWTQRVFPAAKRGRNTNAGARWWRTLFGPQDKVLAAQQRAEQTRERQGFVSQVWDAIAKHDDAFLYGKTVSADAHDIAKAVSLPDKPVTAEVWPGKVTFHGLNGSLDIEGVNTKHPYISSLMADSQGREGGGGSQLYQAALDWIHNNGKQVRNDPGGLTDINAVRRTSNFLSSALRWGTTKHLKPHRGQGVRWSDDHALNTGALAMKEMDHALKAVAAAKKWRYDFDHGEFHDENGSVLSEQDLKRGVARGDPTNSGVGLSTLQRAVTTLSALERFERGRTAGSLHGVANGGVFPRRLKGTLYSKSRGVPGVRGVSAANAAHGVAKLKQTAPAIGEKVRIVRNRDELQQGRYHPDDWASFAGKDATEAFFDPQTGDVVVMMDNVVVRRSETPQRAVVRAILHERVGHAGLAALRQIDPRFEARWQRLVDDAQNDAKISEVLAALRDRGYENLTDDELVEEWFARQVEQKTPEQLMALTPNSLLGKLWLWLKDVLGHVTQVFGRKSWLTPELQEIMRLSREALEQGGPQEQEGRQRVKQAGRIFGALAKVLPLHTYGKPFRVKDIGMRSILTGSPLPKELVKVLDLTENERQSVIQASAQVGRDLQAAVKSYLDRTGKEELATWKSVNEAMEGQPGALMRLGILDPVLAERTRRARNMLDDLSAAVAQTLPAGDLRTAIVQNHGSWMRRGYAAFDPESGWNFDNVMKAAAARKQVAGRDAAQIVAAARAYLRTQNPQNGRTQAEWNADIEADMRDLMDRNQWEAALVDGSTVKKNVSSFMRRKEIAPEIRALMGEETNSLHRFVKSAGFQAQIIARHHGQLAMRQLGLQTGLFSTQRGGVYTQQVTSDGNRWSGLQGVWTTPELWNALERTNTVDLAGTDLGGKLVATLKALGNEAKLNRVALNPDSWLVNIIGNWASLIQSGDVFAWDFIRRMKDAYGLVRSGKAKPGAVHNAAQDAVVDVQRAMLARLRGMGVIGSSITLNDLEASIPRHLLQWVAEDQVRDRALGAAKGALMGQSLGRGLGLPGRIAGGVVGAVGGSAAGAKRLQQWQQTVADYVMTGPDALARVTGFLTNYESALASGMNTDDAAAWATKRTLNTFPNYAALPASLRQLSRLGFVGSFIAFQWEVYRNFGWNVKHCIEELRSDKAAIQARGLRRLAGVASVASLAGGGLAALIGAAGAGTGTDDERNKKWRRWFAAPWEKDAVLAFSKFDREGVSYYNTSYLLPQVTMAELMQAAVSGEDPAAGASRVVDRLLEQFVNGSVHLQPLIAAAMNQDRNGRKITNREGLEGGLIRADSAVETILEPGFAAKIERMIYAIRGAEKNGRSYSVEEELKRLVGVRQMTRTWEELVKRRYSKFTADYMGEREEANKLLGENLPGAAVKAVQRVNARVETLKKELQEYEQDLRRLGIPAETIARAKKDSNLQKLNPVRVRPDGKRVEADPAK